MPPQEQSASERTAAALASLKPVAKNVVAAAEALTGPVMAVDAELRRMHIAFEAWVNYNTYSEGPHDYTNWDIGYSRVDRRWGIALRIVNGDERFPDQQAIESWHFNESPIFLRHRAIDKLPDLIEALAKTGEKVAHRLTAAVTRASTIADTVSPPAKAKK